MRHNYFAEPGFERAGCGAATAVGSLSVSLIRRLFVPVWRDQNPVIEVDGGEPRAIVLGWGGLGPLTGDGAAAEGGSPGRNRSYRRCRGAGAFCADLSPIEAPLDMLHSPALAASGIEAASRPCRSAAIGRAARPARGIAAGAGPRDPSWHARHRFRGLCGSPTAARRRGICAAAPIRPQHDAFPWHRPRRHHVGDARRERADGPLLVFPARMFPPWPALSNRARASKTRLRARCARRAASRSAPSITTSLSPGDSRPISCWGFTPTR